MPQVKCAISEGIVNDLNDVSTDLMHKIDRLEEKNETVTKKIGEMTDDLNVYTNTLERLSSQLGTLRRMMQAQWFLIIALILMNLILVLT